MAAVSAKGLFRSTGKKSFQDTWLEDHGMDATEREADDFYPTPPEVTRALIAYERDRISSFRILWEPAAGDGAMARELVHAGGQVFQSDLIDRGAGAEIKDFYSFTKAPAKAIITNPPYGEINARDGKGRWLEHSFSLGCEYIALFLNWDWPAAAGLAPLLERHPISRAYVCRWKVDFTGNGAPPQRNGWFIWDAQWIGETAFRFMDRKDGRQEVLL